MKKNITETRMALIKMLAGHLPMTHVVEAAKLAEAYIFGNDTPDLTSVSDIDREPSPMWGATASNRTTEGLTAEDRAEPDTAAEEPCNCDGCRLRRLLEDKSRDIGGYIDEMVRQAYADADKPSGQPDANRIRIFRVNL